MSLIFEVHGATKGMLDPGPVLVELALSDGGAARKVVPYGSVLYDITWRHLDLYQPGAIGLCAASCQVDYIDNGWAVLNEGPPAGTAVVAIGVAELYGTEFKIGK